MSDEEKTKRLNLVKYGAFVTFAVVLATMMFASGYITAIFAGDAYAVFKQGNFWLAVVVAGALCYGGYAGYKGYLSKK